MKLPQGTAQSRMLAVLLLISALALVYLLGVHWWFTAPFMQARSELIELRDQELQLRTTAQQRGLVEQRLGEVRAFEAANPEFLQEANFDLAASTLIQRLQALVDAQNAGANCTVISRTPYRSQVEEPFERVTVKVRMRCEVEHLAPVLHGLEAGSPQLFVSDLVVTSRRQFNPRRGQPPGSVDSNFDVYGYLRTAAKEAAQ